MEVQKYMLAMACKKKKKMQTIGLKYTFAQTVLKANITICKSNLCK